MMEDYDDPCATFVELRAAYMRLLKGQAATEVTYLANGVTRTTRFQNTDINAVQREMDKAKAECNGKGGSRRFAITTGSRRRLW